MTFSFIIKFITFIIITAFMIIITFIVITIVVVKANKAFIIIA